MPFCVACGAEHPPTARFCPACGQAVAAAASPTTPLARTRKVVTVLFADIVGSTTLGEEHDPETVQALLADYFAQAQTVMRRHGGTVEKFIGDAVVAIFGVPEAHEDDALRAVRAAVEFRDAVAGMGPDAGSTSASLQVRVGVTTGEVVVGDPATGQSFSVGDAMNTAARLQQAAGAGEVLIGDLTYALAGDAVAVAAAGTLDLKGKHQAVQAWAVHGVPADGTGRRRRLDIPLVGRRSEVAALQRALSAVRATAQCRLVTLLGDAGVGKSKLAHDFVSTAAATALHGRCLSYGEGVTFWPLVEVLRSAVGIDDRADETIARELQRLLAGDDAASHVVPRLLEILTGAGASNTQELFWAVRRFLEAVAADAPAIVLIDDIHWAEPTFLDLLEYLAVWTHAPVLLLCTTRRDLLETRPEWTGVANAEILELPPLGTDHAQQLATSLLGQARLPAEVLRRIIDASEGNPLYVEEMIRMLLDSADDAPPPDEWQVPPTVQALIAARLDRLDRPAQATLQQASVVGIEFSLAAIAAITDDRGARASTPAVLHSLVHREFVIPQPASVEEGYRFAHGLIRDVAYAATPKRQRSELHARLAAWLRHRADAIKVGEYDEIIGHHLAEAATLRIQLELRDEETVELAAQASSLLSSAGRRALARSDMPAATKLLRRAAELSPDQGAAAQLRLELCDGLIEMGALDEVADLLGAVKDVARREDDERLAARTAVMQAMLDMNLDVEVEPDTIVTTFDAAVRVLERAGDFVGCAQAHQVLADVCWNDSRFEAAQKDLETALAFAHRAGDTREHGRIVTWLASALLWGPTPTADAIERCEQMIHESRGDLLVEGKTLLILAGLYGFQGRFADARTTFARSRTILENLGLSLTLASGTQVSGMIEMLAGDPGAAETEFRRGYDALVAMGQKGYLPAAAAFLATALLAQQRYDETAALAEELRETAAEDDEAAQGDHARIAARLAVARGDTAAAVVLAEQAVDAYAGTDEVKSHADALLDLALAHVAAGATDAAREAASLAHRLYELKGITPAMRAAVGLLDEIEARSPQAPT